MSAATLEKRRFVTIVLAIALGVGGCTAMLLGDGTRSAPTSKTTTTSDIALGRDVWQALADARLPERESLSVSVRNGVVTLSGRASSEAVRDQAGRIAGSVAGVRQVVNNIR
ncbi:MAG: BON domain-containing protein [Pseudomonadota bacterium]